MSSDQSAAVIHSKRTLSHSPKPRQSRKRSKQPLQEKLYEYETLGPDEIRVLLLNPIGDSESLYGTLETVRLHDPPEYRAISYVWGEPVFNHTIRLPGGILRITASLASALRRFREPTEPVRLWADAICINQSSIPEKNHQVAQMAEIYLAAEEVYIWLGEADPIDTERFWLLNLFAAGEQRFRAEQGYETSNGTYSFHQDERDPYYPVIPAQGTSLACHCCKVRFSLQATSLDEAVISVFGIWDKSWFQRLWVVQEALLAKIASFYCGSHHFSKKDLGEARTFLYSFFYNTEYGIANCDVFADDYQPWVDPNCSKLLNLLIHNRDRRCRDPRDRLYAILGLCDMIPMPLPPPDYSVELCRLWKEFSSSVLTFAENWNWDMRWGDEPHPAFILVLAGLQQHEEHSLPSWSVDLGCLDSISNEIGWKMDHYHSSIPGLPGGVFRPENLLYRVGHNELHCRVSVLGTLENILPASSPPDFSHLDFDDQDQDLDFWLTSRCVPWMARCRKFLHVQNLAKARDDVPYLLGALCAHDGLEKIPRTADAFTKCAVEGQDSCEDNDEFSTHLKVLRRMDLTFAFHYHQRNRQARLAMASSGRPCWIPPKAAIGDRIFLLPGSPYVFLLRPQINGQYKLVGDAYVHGIMNGEAAPREEDLETIILV